MYTHDGQEIRVPLGGQVHSGDGRFSNTGQVHSGETRDGFIPISQHHSAWFGNSSSNQAHTSCGQLHADESTMYGYVYNDATASTEKLASLSSSESSLSDFSEDDKYR